MNDPLEEQKKAVQKEIGRLKSEPPSTLEQARAQAADVPKETKTPMPSQPLEADSNGC